MRKEKVVSINTEVEYPVVQTSHGKVMGENKNGVAIFRGIPYGGDCDGKSRFLPPVPAKDWEGVRDCTKNGYYAVQDGTSISGSKRFGEYFSGGHPELFGVAEEKQSENCLVLNVLTPGADENKRPVVVYIHGGGFATGSGTLVIGADKWVREEDIVLVGINHRLNVFGYLYLGAFDKKYADSGMAGMLDLVLALEWVRDNIGFFGGDPAKVTIMGESGGGMKVSTLMAMDKAKGLFRAAICESGSAPVGCLSKEEAAKTAEMVLKELHIQQKEWEIILDVPAEELLAVTKKLPRASLCPVADGRNLPWNKTGQFYVSEVSREIPMLIGASEDEEGAFADEGILNINEQNLRDALLQNPPGPWGQTCNETNVDKILDSIRKMDRETGKVAKTPEHIFLEAVSLSGRLGGGAYYHALSRARDAKAPVYHYMIAYDAPHISWKGKRYSWHTADLPLQMRVVLHPESEGLSKAMAHAWAAFARNLNPSTEVLDWPAFTPEKPYCMVVDDILQVKLDPYRELREAFEAK